MLCLCVRAAEEEEKQEGVEDRCGKLARSRSRACEEKTREDSARGDA